MQIPGCQEHPLRDRGDGRGRTVQCPSADVGPPPPAGGSLSGPSPLLPPAASPPLAWVPLLRLPSSPSALRGLPASGPSLPHPPRGGPAPPPAQTLSCIFSSLRLLFYTQAQDAPPPHTHKQIRPLLCPFVPPAATQSDTLPLTSTLFITPLPAVAAPSPLPPTSCSPYGGRRSQLPDSVGILQSLPSLIPLRTPPSRLLE